MMAGWINGALSTCGFELKRSFTLQRLAVSLVMILFPPVMICLLVLGPQTINSSPGVPFVPLLIALLVALVCVLTLLLWATPNVYSELEGKSWVFIASRPGGRIGLFLGKYLAAVVSSFVVAFTSLTICVGLTSVFSNMEDPLRFWGAMSGVYLLACLTYGAVFSAIGTLTIKRAMVVAVGYMIVSEGLVAGFPALISRFTARFYLQWVGIEWGGWLLPQDKQAFETLYGTASVPFSILMLAVITSIALFVGMYVIVNRQYITADET